MTKTSILFAALLGAAAVTAQAGELYTPGQFQDPQSGLTRAQVKQQVLQARKAGELNHNDIDLPDEQTTVAFGKTRTAARADVLAERSTGGLEHNDVDLPQIAKGSVLTRQEVRADAVASRQLVRTTNGRNTIAY